jgi:hypothetical protein
MLSPPFNIQLMNKLQEGGFSPSIKNPEIEKFISLLSLCQPWKLRKEFTKAMNTP